MELSGKEMGGAVAPRKAVSAAVGPGGRIEGIVTITRKATGVVETYEISGPVTFGDDENGR